MLSVQRSQTLPSGVHLQIAQGDLTRAALDAIVNAANELLAHGGGLAGAIARAGGPAIQAESSAWVRLHGPVSHEKPAWTGAGALPCRWVIHAVGPVWGAGEEDAKLAAAVRGALRTAEQLGAQSVGLPAISTGIFGFPVERAARIILEAAADHLAAEPPAALKTVAIVLWDEQTLNRFVAEFDRRYPA